MLQWEAIFLSPTTMRPSAPCSTRRCRAPAMKCAPPAMPPRSGAGCSQGDGDLVITDVVMPDENAFDLLPRIKKLRPDLPIIVMSAQNTFMTAIKASERGAYEYLPKPFDLRELVSDRRARAVRAEGRASRPDNGRRYRKHAAGRPLAGDAGNLSRAWRG